MSERTLVEPPPAPPRASGGPGDRLLGRVVGARPGPTLVVVGGVHGNEPSGVEALHRVVAALEGRENAVRGEVVALAGNLPALARGVRHVDGDLNRCWLEGPTGGRWGGVEEREQAELAAAIDGAFRRARGPTFALDLHSTSAPGPPFAILDDTLPNRAFASRLPVPIVLGLEEQLAGTLLAYLTQAGHVAAAFEAGQHRDPMAVEHAEAAVWIALEASGVLDPEGLAPPRRLGERLAAAGAGLPRFVEARHRHAIRGGDGFQMEPGFANFQPVAANQLLARDRRGEIRSPAEGLMLMPLYQPQGDDGFFLVRAFSPFWLRLSATLRRLRADRLVHWLPGVRRHPELAATFLVDRGVARWLALELFHLLGFRRAGEADGLLLVTRRPHDRDGRRPSG